MVNQIQKSMDNASIHGSGGGVGGREPLSLLPMNQNIVYSVAL